MKTIKHVVLMNNEKPIVDLATQKELNTGNLITICLGQSKFVSTAEQWQAYDITKSIKSGEDVNLEESDYALVKAKVEAFEPYRTGFAFIPFLELFK